MHYMEHKDTKTQSFWQAPRAALIFVSLCLCVQLKSSSPPWRGWIVSRLQVPVLLHHIRDAGSDTVWVGRLSPWGFGACWGKEIKNLGDYARISRIFCIFAAETFQTTANMLHRYLAATPPPQSRNRFCISKLGASCALLASRRVCVSPAVGGRRRASCRVCDECVFSFQYKSINLKSKQYDVH